MTGLIISVSGLRGVVGESLNPEVAARYVTAFAAELPPGPIVLTHDGRTSGPILADAVRAALAAAGRLALDAGVAATPTTGVLVRVHGAAGGVQISASHNPAEYNGIKLFAAAGLVLSAEQGRKVLDRYHSSTGQPVAASATAPGQCIEDSVSTHAALIRGMVDTARIRARRFRVVLDANHGAGSLLGRVLLTELGCQLTVLGGEPDGQFAHQPEPTEANLVGVLPAVCAAEADVGFCQDPDADRLAVVDRWGRYLGEEYTLAMCVDHILSCQPGPVVTNCSTSRMSEDLAARYGVPFHRSPVGEANVVDAMLACDAVVGGEGNGGVIEPRVGLVRDSFVGMALLLDAMATREATISELAAQLPRYAIHKTKVALHPDRVADGLARLQTHFAGAQASTLDGLRLDWPNGWLLVRASNTEPQVRIVAEASTASGAAALCDQARHVLGAEK